MPRYQLYSRVKIFLLRPFGATIETSHLSLSLSLSPSLALSLIFLSFYFTAWSSFSPLLRTFFYRSFLSVPCIGLFNAAIGSTYFVSFGFCCNIPSHNSFHPFHSISLFIYFTFPPWGTLISVIWSPIFNTFRDSNIACLPMNGETLVRLFFRKDQCRQFGREVIIRAWFSFNYCWSSWWVGFYEISKAYVGHVLTKIVIF